MAAFKIFAALFVVCVAQASAASLPMQWDKPMEDTDVAVADPFGLRFPNPFACMGHFPEVWNVFSELNGFWKEYKDIQATAALMKSQCEAMPDPASKELCIKNAEDMMSQKTNELLKKTQDMIPRVVKLMWNLKECLFG